MYVFGECSRRFSDDLVSDSDHILGSDHGRYYCKLCLSSFRTDDTLFRDWVASPCSGQPSAAASGHSRPTPLNSMFLHVGNQFIHQVQLSVA